MSEVTIRDIQAILTEPDDIRLVIVKVETSEPGLYGLGCATHTMRVTAVEVAIRDYLRPLLIGRDVADIEDIWQSAYVSSYWRNGPILNNALSGIDQALWDIKGKMAGMPVYDLLGGKAREAAAVYVHASGDDPLQVEDGVRHFMGQGFHHIRVQVATPGFEMDYGTSARSLTEVDLQYGRNVRKRRSTRREWREHEDGPRWITQQIRDYDPSKRYAHTGGVFEPKPYMRSVLDLLEHLRSQLDFGVELLHDVHERIPPNLGVWFAKAVEPYQLFFLEDLFSPEEDDYFGMVRQQCGTPIAMGELYTHPHEIIPMVKDRLIDFIRVHISMIGGITPARKIAAMCELFGVRTAWHGPGDTSPVGHAANLMLDLSCSNFGIQEVSLFSERTMEMFPGCPEVRDGYLWPNDRPGLGIDIDEEMATQFPLREVEFGGAWDPPRRADGSVVKP